MNPVASIRRRLRDAHPDHARIARAMGSVLVFVLLAKLAGALKEAVVAWRYGVSEVVDAYVFVLNMLNWLPSLTFGVLSAVLVPLSARLAEDGQGNRRRFFAELNGHTLCAGIALGALLASALAIAATAGWLGFTAPTAAMVRELSLAMVPVLPLGMLIALASARLMALEHHANTLFEGIPALVLMLVLLAWHEVGTAPLLWGTLAGVALQLGALGWKLRGREPIGWPRLSRSTPVWQPFWRGVTVILAGQFVMSLGTVIDQTMAAGLGVGAIATLGYANRLVSLVLSLSVTVVARSVLPVFSARVAAGDPDGAIRHGRSWAAAMFAGGWLAVALGYWLAPYGVRLVFERGAFTAQDTEVVAALVRVGLVQLPFYIAGTILAQLLAALNRLPLVAAVAVMNLAVKLSANLLFVPILGAKGLLLASACMYAGSASAFWWLTRYRVARANR